jgi:hypothetical protein
MLLKNLFNPKHIIGLLILFFSSCKKFIEVDPPANVVTMETLFSDDQTATSAVNGLYSQMMISNLFFANSAMAVFPGLSADELMRTVPDGSTDPFQKNAIMTNSSQIEINLWKRGYNHIYHANAILKGLANSTGLTKATKDQLTGEAKFVRAFCHFYLVNLFGDVPLITGTDYQINQAVPRTSAGEIYQQIISDLKDAQNLMSASYPTAGKVRPTKNAATALLARVYLYQKNWAEAEAQATLLISSGTYSLASLNSVFLANSSEAIWQLLPVLSSINTADGITFIPGSPSARPNYIVTDWLLNSFEANDQRKTSWLKTNTVSGQNYTYPYKYKTRLSPTIAESNMVFRLGEMYLIRAEARAEQNNITGAQADIDAIRIRAGLSSTTANDKATLLTAIAQERRIELFAEWGHRWFDLKRTNRIDAVLSIEKPLSWQSTDALYPIPLSELQTNPALIQNPGY